jgi:RNA recognition motif-containing protein
LDFMETLFVSALPFKVTDQELRSLFQPYGEIRSITIHADWEKATYEPYAHIEMNNADAAIRALDGLILGPTYLRVNKLINLDKA